MYTLFIDESGKNTLKGLDNWPPHFSIGGVLIHDDSKDFVKRRGDQIKFKYWGHTKVTFRGNNLRRLDGDFEIFADEIDPATGKMIEDKSELRKNFYSDFIEYIRKSNFKFIWIGVNKNDLISKDPILKNAITNNWQVTGFEKKLTRQIFEELVKTYICYLKRKSTSGKIMVEASDMTQDGDILSIYNQFMFQGLSSMGLSSTLVRDILTCISFATKNNRDAETQLADIGSHFLSLKARQEDNVKYKTPEVFEVDIIKAFEQKSFADRCNALQPSSIRRLA